MTKNAQPTRRLSRVQSARVAIWGSALVLGCAIGLFLLTYGPGAYRGWREARQLKNAAALLAQQDFDGAVRAAREIVLMRPDAVAAFSILAEASEKQNSPETVTWRAQIARLQPQDLDSQLNLASAALRFGQLDTARKALENVAPKDRDRAAYHVVAGWLARAQGNDAEVEQHFAAALSQEPTNDLYRFNLAVLRIHSDAPEKSEESRKVLEQLSKVPAFRAGSLRALLGDAVQRDEIQRADTLAQDLQMSQQVTFTDYLLCLELYHRLDQEKFSTLLEKVKPVAARNPSDLTLLLEWLNKNGLAADILKWMEKLPEDLTAHPPPSIAIADALVETKSWSRLKRWTRSDSWGESEYLRLAYQAYGAKQARQSAADPEFVLRWQSAEQAAADRPDREIQLARLASKWNLPAEAERLWMRVSQDASSRREALEALLKLYRTNNDLTNLSRTAQRLHETSPNEPGLAADYARLALLVDPNSAEGHRIAKEAYERAPTNANVATTYAFSLRGLGLAAEGIEIMNKLPEDQRHDSHTAVYAAVLLLDENQIAAAQEYIAAAHAGSIFPEEKKLLEEAIAKTSPVAPGPTVAPSPGPTR